MAKLKPDFAKRNVKVIGLSVDPVDKHAGWAKDIEETQGYAPNFPMIGDPELTISKLYDMLPASAGDYVGRAHRRRQPDRAHRLRHRPRQEDQAVDRLSDDDRPELRRDPPRHRFAPAHRQAQGVDAGELEAGRGRHHRRLGHRRRGEEDLSGRLEGAEALHPHRAASWERKTSAGVW